MAAPVSDLSGPRPLSRRSGSYVTTLAVQVLVVLTLRGGPAAVGVVSAARWLPYLLFGVFAGVFVDRARRRPILVSTGFQAQSDDLVVLTDPEGNEFCVEP